MGPDAPPTAPRRRPERVNAAPQRRAATLPLSASEAAKSRQLVASRRQATALLALVAVVFVGASLAGEDAGWLGYLRAGAEASLIGGLADWFAVTALFRHPLGVPIPHTAIVRERKDQFGATLGAFVQESFLTPESVVERVRSASVAARAAGWIAAPANAARVAGHLADAAVALLDAVDDDDVHRLLEDVVRNRLENVALAPLAGRALRFLTDDGRHDEVLDAAIAGLERWLDEHRGELAARFGTSSPWWLPDAVEHRIFERLLDGTRSVLREMASDRDHELRRHFDARLEHLATELETSPELLRRGEELKAELLEQPQVREWVASSWAAAKPELRAQAGDPASPLRKRLEGAVAAAGARLRDDPVLVARVQDGVETAAGYVVRHFSGEIAALVSGTIARWDGEETSRRLELLLGPDLQYIRINGTVVGGVAGLGLHAVAQALG